MGSDSLPLGVTSVRCASFLLVSSHKAELQLDMLRKLFMPFKNLPSLKNLQYIKA